MSFNHNDQDSAISTTTATADELMEIVNCNQNTFVISSETLIDRCRCIYISLFGYTSPRISTYTVKTSDDEIDLTYLELLQLLTVIGPHVQELRLHNIQVATNIIINKCKNIQKLVLNGCSAHRRLNIDEFPDLIELAADGCDRIFGPRGLFSYENLSQIKYLFISTLDVKLYPEYFKYATNLQRFETFVFFDMKMMKPVIEFIVNNNHNLDEILIHDYDKSIRLDNLLQHLEMNILDVTID